MALWEREAWARPSKALVEAALITPEDPLFENQIPDSVMGASQLLEELGLQFDILDMDGDLSGYPLIILPDGLCATKEFQQKLDAYVGGGGKVRLLMAARRENGQCPSFESTIWKTILYPDCCPEGASGRGLEEGSRCLSTSRGRASSRQSRCHNGAGPLLQKRTRYVLLPPLYTVGQRGDVSSGHKEWQCDSLCPSSLCTVP
ncbi:MAG: beta-galactosidase trimerization domain-containing protein [Bianqueaceae bacterium]